MDGLPTTLPTDSDALIALLKKEAAYDREAAEDAAVQEVEGDDGSDITVGPYARRSKKKSHALPDHARRRLQRVYDKLSKQDQASALSSIAGR